MYKANKKSARYYATHSNDIYTDLGYDYHNGTILSKTLSPVILKNKKNKAMLSNVERIICYLIDSVKQIKAHFMFSVDKKEININ
jgi:helix-turn-helix protein